VPQRDPSLTTAPGPVLSVNELLDSFEPGRHDPHGGKTVRIAGKVTAKSGPSDGRFVLLLADPGREFEIREIGKGTRASCSGFFEDARVRDQVEVGAFVIVEGRCEGLICLALNPFQTGSVNVTNCRLVEIKAESGDAPDETPPPLATVPEKPDDDSIAPDFSKDTPRPDEDAEDAEDAYVFPMVAARNALLAGRFDEAMIELGKALRAKPADPAATELRKLAQGRVRPRQVPFHEDFAKVKPGDLPEDWTGDPVVGVYHEGADSFVKPSASGTHRLVTPPVVLPENFELEVLLSLRTDSQQLVTMAIVDAERGASGVTVFFRERYRGRGFGFEGGPSGETSWSGWLRMRLVRDGSMYRLFIADRMIQHQAVVPTGTMQRIEFHLKDEAKLKSLSLIEHPDHAPPVAPTPFVELFANVPVGDLPQGWSALGAVSVGRKGNASWLQPTARGTHAVRTPRLVFPRDFVFETMAEFLKNSSSMWVFLEGSGNSPDLVLQFDTRIPWSDTNPETITAAFSGADSRAVAVPHTRKRPLLIRLEKEGEIFRLSVGEHQNVIAQRKPEFQRFQRVAFLLEQEVCLRGVMLKDRSAHAGQPVRPEQPPDGNAAQPAAAGPLSGTWRETKSLYQIKDDGATYFPHISAPFSRNIPRSASQLP
jgi:hypothetical protein